MTETEAVILLVILLLYVIWSAIRTLSDLIDSLFDWFTPQPDKPQKWLKNGSYTAIVNQCIQFTNDILYNLDIDHFPSFQIYYYRHKKYFGQFDGEVKIYTKNHNTVAQLVDTVLHEIAHFIQSQTDPDYAKYNQYTKKHGEWNNPFEVEAREFASEHLNDCLLYLEQKGLVLRV